MKRYILLISFVMSYLITSAQFTENKDSKIDPSDFTCIDFGYTASFKAAEYGSYGYNIKLYTSGGFGAEWGMGANFGLIDSHFSGVFFRLGAVYGYAFSDCAMLSTSFGFDGSYHGTGTYISYGQASSGNYYPITRSGDLKFDWGLSLKPQIILKAGKILPQAGLTFSWSKNTSKIGIGFVVGIGISLL